jgi:penicillin-binding protein 1A
MPGTQVQCPGCASPLAVTYPPGVMDDLRQRGKHFQSGSTPTPTPRATAPRPPPPRPPAPPPPAPPPRAPAASPRPQAAPPVDTPTPATQAATRIDRTTVDRTVAADDHSPLDFERTVRSARTPSGGLPNGTPEADGTPRPVTVRPAPSRAEPTRALGATPEIPRATAATPGVLTRRQRTNQRFKRFMLRTAGGLVGLALLGAAAASGGAWVLSRELPSTETLRAYEPPTVTMVFDRDGEILGELYEERRYVLPLDQIPKYVQNAFIASEDANFWQHDGVDYFGIVRAVVANTLRGRKAQGASTITQQVTRGFLLTNEKTITRKVKEILLSWRIEDTYTKDHILYLYLNQIYLGSSAYGVEAASRVYFGKSVGELTLGEAAMLAGLPQRPSDYSPHRKFESAKARQGYVLEQMVRNGYITPAESAAARAEEIRIVERANEFLERAPHFTEHVRRYLVEKYGNERVVRGGLRVRTTCDLDLQRLAQKVVTERVTAVDQDIGFRREGIVTLPDADAIRAKRAELEQAMKAAWAKEQDPAGRIPEPARSVLDVGRVYEGVLLEVQKNWAKVGIGDHEGVIPLAWSDWVYPPDPNRSTVWRNASDLTASVDSDGDGKKEGGILRRGDVVKVRIEGPTTLASPLSKIFAGTPGASRDLVAARLWQEPELEASLLSADVHTGAVRAMVGGADFTESQFNRVTQATRQVGSTFKPIVYGAAIATRRITAASLVADAPLAFATNNSVWKPGNFSDEFLGNITVRKALALSKNTCTVRIFESIDPGMNQDVIYAFARKLGIGGTPTHLQPAGWVPTPENDHLCPWIREEKDFTVCTDRYPSKDPNLSNTAHREQMGADDIYRCRACDYSMALGSAALTMEELARAYAVFGNGGNFVQPYYIDEVADRHGNVLEAYTPPEPVQVVEPGVASIVNWLMQGVVTEGTAAAANRLGLTIAGKTGTTNDSKDTWFVGLTPNVITGVWVGYDTPRSIGVSATGGRTALPIWIDYMEEAAPKAENSGPFPMLGDIEWAQIDEATGRRVTSGGRSYPFLSGTVPEGEGQAGQATLEDLSTDG